MPRQADVISATLAESAELALENNTTARQQLIELIWESRLCVREKHTHAHTRMHARTHSHTYVSGGLERKGHCESWDAFK